MLFPALVSPAVRLSCSGAWSSCCRNPYAWTLLSALPRLGRLIVGLSCFWLCLAVVTIGGWLRLCGGACPPSGWGVLGRCTAPLMVGRAVVVFGPPHGEAWPPSWWGVAPLMLGRGPPHAGAWLPSWWGVLWWGVPPPDGGACCGGSWPTSWWGGGPIMVVLGPPHGGAWPPLGGACCDGAWQPSWLRVLWRCVAPLMVGGAVLLCGPPNAGPCCGGAWAP